MKARCRIALVLSSLLVTACQTMPDSYTAQFQREGEPPAYIDGHADGCRSGLSAAGNPYVQATKDPTRFAQDSMYAQGWNDGFSTCKEWYKPF
ncbi:hypothetical protein QF000_000605 [Paraburkholderia atlantica]|uniref:Lipoprotein n=1 Tax=Paraburkholderia youngii TaxID=2782701 RepID=A0A7W8P617_9BURK|nr:MULTISPECIES: hypothetical protein [Paraburkholderia]MBB5406064.1 hypothetical protein [Paraburkholderia youngii]MPW11528.1 hypothetical protein [Paraburkholderia atlantica]NUY36135.1 hypothetical protein [Paraburkholderia atlantica]